ncbi:hypothetical protein ACOZ4L_05650 [Haloplanus ruber]|uniref:Uncharacterized protein n=1 Tax=Haloplanus ruber TaxID=869892 RepID=A0ABD6CW95_9EURY|nr:hypothetical protein [Haloplanus ruber]
MSITVEFGSKAAADAYRDDHEEYICPVDDDRRLKTVAFMSDTPEWLLDQARLDAEEGRAEREASAGQATLTDGERDRIDFSEGRANVPHARAVKGIATDHGVDDWTAHYDPTLTVDEHREVMERAGREGGGQRLDANEGRQAARARDAARAQQSSECDHAAGHCENGDPEACEFLQNVCEYNEKEVNEMLPPVASDGGLKSGDPGPDELTGQQAGAVHRSMGGYAGAVDSVESALETLREEWSNAQQAAKAVNSVRRSVGYEPQHFDRLEELQAERACHRTLHIL